MFNVTILKMKDIKKYVIGILTTSIFVIAVSKYFPQVIKEEKIVEKLIGKNSMIQCLGQTIPAMSGIEKENEETEIKEEFITESDFLHGVLKTQVSTIKVLENIGEKEEPIITKEEQEQETTKEENIEMAEERLRNRSNY